MDSIYSQSTNNRISDQNGLASDHQESSGAVQAEFTSSLPTIDQTILDRLNAVIAQEQGEKRASIEKYSLDQLGSAIRQWRLRQGYPREVLAGQLQIDVNQLICIENGIAQADEILREQLLTLKKFLAEDEAEPLRTVIQQVLAALKEC